MRRTWHRTITGLLILALLVVQGPLSYAALPAITASPSVPAGAELQTQLQPPARLQAVLENNTVILTWELASDEAVTYKIYRDQAEIGATSSPRYADDAPPTGVHTYTVKASNAEGQLSPPSNTITLDLVRQPQANRLDSPVEEQEPVQEQQPEQDPEQEPVEDPEQAPVQEPVPEPLEPPAGPTRPDQPPREETSLTPPGHLAITAQTENSVTLDWEASAGSTDPITYTVLRNGEEIAALAETTYTDTGLTPGTYIYQVKASDSNNASSEESDEVTATITGPGRILNRSSGAENRLAAGAYHSLVIKGDGSLWAWGRNYYGQLGNGGSANSNLPLPITSCPDAEAVAGGYEHTIVLKKDGSVCAWGKNNNGQLGNGATVNSRMPVPVSGLDGVVQVSAGYEYSLALKEDGTVWAWGCNSNGQLGNGSNQNSSVPVQIPGLTGIVAISAGNQHSLALKNDGTVWSWGYNYYSQLGNGSNRDSNTPVQVHSLTGVIAVSAGGCHSLALKEDGSVWTWGYNGYGQLGNGSNAIANLPVRVPNLQGICQMSAGSNHSLALKEDGSVWAWGYNGYGQLGTQSTENSSLPVAVLGLSGISAISAAGSHSLALNTAEEIWAWGHNGFGQLGNGDNNNSSVPVCATRDSQAPTAPSQLIVNAAGNSARLRWKASYDARGVAGYEIYRNDTRINTSTATSYQDNDLDPDETYTYYVQAVDAAGNISAPSNSAIRDCLAPTAPANLRVMEQTTTSVTLAWDAASDNIGVTGYSIYRDGQKIIDVGATSHTDTKLAPSQSYTYVVKAFDAGENLSAASNEITAGTNVDQEPPGVPSQLRISRAGETFIELSWQAPSDDYQVKGYEVFNHDELIAETATTNARIANFKDGDVFTVKAVDPAGNISEASLPLLFSDSHGNNRDLATDIALDAAIPGKIDYRGDLDYLRFTAGESG